jgi:TonB family protein
MGRVLEILTGRDRRRLITGLAISALVHLVVAILLLTVPSPPDVATRRESVRLRILDQANSTAKLSPRTKKPEPLDGQVVDLPKPAVEQAPDEARFLSQWDRKVEKEMKARRMPTGKAGVPGSPQGTGEPGPPPAAGQAEGAVALPSATPMPAVVPSGKPAPDRPGKGIRGLAGLDKMLVPSLGGARGAARSAGTLGGGGGGPLGGMISSDAVLGVAEEGDQTLVNTRSFKYWDFFQRVKERVRGEWSPGGTYQARDPYGKVYGSKDRLTVLSVVLDAKGDVVRLQVVRESGLPFLDEEALRAFRQAGPFPNPPSGLADDSGRIEFSFGFLLEVGATKGRFFWQREE